MKKYDRPVVPSSWCSIGGHFESGLNDAKACALNYYFFADLANMDLQLNYCDEGLLEWVDSSEVLKREMPFTAKGVLHYLSVGMHDNKIYAGITTDEQVIFHALNEF